MPVNPYRFDNRREYELLSVPPPPKPEWFYCPHCRRVYRALFGEWITCRRCGTIFECNLDNQIVFIEKGIKRCPMCGRRLPRNYRGKYCKECRGIRRYNQLLRVQLHSKWQFLSDVTYKGHIREKELLEKEIKKIGRENYINR